MNVLKVSDAWTVFGIIGSAFLFLRIAPLWLSAIVACVGASVGLAYVVPKMRGG